MHIMAYKTLTIRESAYETLKNWREKNESFSDVIEREFGRRIRTGQDALDWLDEERKAGRNSLAQRADSPYRRKK